MEKGLQPEQICEEIMTECLSPDLLMTGTDNMTIVLICFLHNKSYWEFCKRAAEYCQRLFPDDEKCENGAQAVISSEQREELRRIEKDLDDLSSSSDDEPAAEKESEQNGGGAAGDSTVGNEDAPASHENANNKTEETEEDEASTQESKKFKDQQDEHTDNAENSK